MFSATWPEEVRSLATDFQSDPTYINIGSSELSANANIKQSVFIIDPQQKEEQLLRLLSDISKQVSMFISRSIYINYYNYYFFTGG